ncbi:MAG: hypothetical protein ACXABY_08455 [Candidatus Thorarchaeota archaeon]|jgi:hypothetical protein
MIDILRVNPPRVPEWWPHIQEGLGRALDNSQNFRTLDSIYDELITGNWILWVVVEEDKLLGAAITEVLSTERGMYCNIPFAFSLNPRRDIHSNFLDYIENSAREYGFKGVKFISSRPGYARRAKKLGYKLGFQEYRKEFK